MRGRIPVVAARDVLPPELYQACLPYVAGKTVYVASPREGLRGQRRVQIRSLAALGLSRREIARRVRCSERHVYRCLQHDQQQGFMSD